MLWDRLLKMLGLRASQPIELTADEFRTLLDRQIRESLNMSLSDFEARLADGTIDPEEPRIARLAVLVGDGSTGSAFHGSGGSCSSGVAT